MQNLIHGLGALGNGPAIAYLVGGALLGVFVGVIPGLGSVIILSVLLVVIYHVNLTGTLCLFLGVQSGSFYAASVSAILINTPSHPESFPITLDGYPMARKGQPGRALGLSAGSTCIGGLIGCGVLVACLPVMDYFALIFHPTEFVALVTLAMLLVGTFGADSVGKTIASAGAGLLLATIGPAVITGVYRYTFGAVGFSSGISLPALALGVFAIPQMVMVFGTGKATARQDMTGKELVDVEAVEIGRGYGKEILGGVWETFRHWPTVLQSGIVGGVTGMIPGIGGFTGNLMAYGVAKQTSGRKKRALFGTGIPEGIIAPEGSSLAKEAGHMIPLLGLGIPGGIVGALFIGALSIKGVNTGAQFQQAHPNVTGQIIWIIALGGIIGTVAGLLIGPQIARITGLPGPLIVPFIFATCALGPFLTDAQFFSVVEMVAFGIIGLAFRRLRYPLGSFILGFVLGPTFEENIYLSRSIYPGVSFIVHRPLADAIFFLCLLVLVSKAVELRRETKTRKSEFAKEIAHLDDPVARTAAARDQMRRSAPYPLMAVIVTFLLIAASLFFIVYGLIHYNAATVSAPLVASLLILIPCACYLPRDILRYVLYRKAKGQPGLSLAIPGGQISKSEIVGSGAEMPETTGLMDMMFSQELREQPTPTPAIGGPATILEKSWKRHGEYRREVIAFAWMFATVALCWIFGFEWGAVIFMVAYGFVSTRLFLKTFRTRLIFTAISSATVWLIFYEIIRITHLLFVPKINL